MISLAVINLKTLLKKVTRIIIIILTLAMIIKFSKILYQASQTFQKNDFYLKNNISMIKSNLNCSNCFEKNEKKKSSEFKKILVAQLAVFSGAEEELMEKENQEEVIEFDNIEKEKLSKEIKNEEQEEILLEMPQKLEEKEEILEKIPTTVIQANNKKDIYTDIYQSVQIKNESKYSLTEEMVTPNAMYQNAKDIIIYHTHTCESYTQTLDEQYVSTGNYRTTDLNHSVARVGTELSNQLAGRGYTVIHDTTYHDYPAYTGSYTRSLSTIQNLLSTYQTVDCIFDIHRDALRN